VTAAPPSHNEPSYPSQPSLHELAAERLLITLQVRGVQFTVTDGKLRYTAPPGALDDELLAALRTHKDAVLALLTDPQAPVYLDGITLAAEQERIGARMWTSANADAPDRDGLVDEFRQHANIWRAWRDAQTDEAAAIAQQLDRALQVKLFAQMDADQEG
jgi:hypothetical protein